MTDAELLSLVRLQQAEVARWQAIREHDDAIVACLEVGLSTRQIATVAGVDQSSIVRRGQRLGFQPQPKE